MVEKPAVETKEPGTSSGGIGGNESNGGSGPAAAASRSPAKSSAGVHASAAAAASGFANSRGREGSSPLPGAGSPSGQRLDRGTTRDGDSAPPIAATFPAPGAASPGGGETASATGPTGAAGAAAEPHRLSGGKPGERASRIGGQKRRRRSGVACLRDYNVKGLAEDGRKGRRAGGEGSIPPARRSKRSRKQKVSSTG